MVSRMNEIGIYTVAPDDSEFPSTYDLIAKFNEIFAERGSPARDALDSQMMIMMTEVAMAFEVFVASKNDAFIFFPKDIDEDDAVDLYVKSTTEQEI